MHLKLFQKEQLKKGEATGNLIGHKIADKNIKSQEVHQRIVQKQLKVKQKIQDLIQKYQKRDTYFSRKKTDIVHDLRYYNNIIME